MKPYTHILFDLDGTITDPAEGITTCVRHALHCQGIEEENYQNLPYDRTAAGRGLPGFL